jgi:hypothetical protein
MNISSAESQRSSALNARPIRFSERHSDKSRLVGSLLPSRWNGYNTILDNPCDTKMPVGVYNVDFDRERQTLAEVERHIAEAKELIERQRLIHQSAVKKGAPSIETRDTLVALESSLRMFETHRQRLLEVMMGKAP